MSNTKLIFCDSDASSDYQPEMQADVTEKNKLLIQIDDLHRDDPPSFITLDKETAIRFVKHLKKEISFIPEEGTTNG